MANPRNPFADLSDEDFLPGEEGDTGQQHSRPQDTPSLPRRAALSPGNMFAGLSDADFQPSPDAVPIEDTEPGTPSAQPSAAAPPQGDKSGIDLGPFNMTVGAVRDAAQGVINLGSDALNEWLDVANPARHAASILRHFDPNSEGAKALDVAGNFRTKALALPQIARSDHEWVNVGRSILKYVTGAALGVAGLRAVAGPGLGATAEGIIGGFIGDFAVASKEDGNLSQLIEESPALANPVTAALAVDSNDSDWEVRLKTALEGTVVGVALTGLVRTVGILRGARKVAEKEGASAAKAFLEKHADELSELADDIKHAPEQLELFPDVVRREDAIKDVEVLIRGDRVIDPLTGEGRALKLSEGAREEISRLASTGPDDLPHKLGSLSEASRAEVVAELRRVGAVPSDVASLSGAVGKLVRPRPFQLADAARIKLGEALRKSVDAGPLADDLASQVGELVPEIRTAFNYRFMDTPESVKMVIDDFAQALKPMMDARRGGEVQTFKDVQGLADVLSVKPGFLMSAISNAARHAELMPAYLVAGKVWVQSLSRDIVSLAKAIDAGTVTATAEIELMRRVSVLEDLTVNLKGLQTAGARTTAVGRIRTADALTPTEITQLLDGMDRTNVRMVARKLALAETPKQVVGIVQGTGLGRVIGIANEVFINGLLSGIKTHVINVTTSALNTILLPSYRIVGATLTGDLETAKEGLYFLRALKGNLGDAVELSAKAFRSETSILDSSFRQVELNRHEIVAANFNLNSDTVKLGIEGLGTAVRMPSRFLTSEDEFFKQLSYRASVTASATREAYERGLRDDVLLDYFVDGNLTRLSQVDTYVLDRLNKAFDPKHGFALDQKALADARRVTFTQPLREDTWLGNKPIGERIQELAAGHPFLRHVVFPFVRVPTNIMREAVYMTPLAPLRRQFWSDIQAGGTRKADAVGRMAIGSTLSLFGTLLAAEGTITGAGPTDPDLLKTMKASGWQPYSFKIGDTYVSYQRLDPFATVLGVIADAAQVVGKHQQGVEDELLAGITLAVANAINSRTYLRGLTDLLSIVARGGDQDSRLAAGLKQRLASYVPSIARDLTADPEVKRVRTYLDALMARTPGLSDQVEAHRDNFGNKVVAPMGFPWSAINPFAFSVDKDSAPYMELREWADGPLKARFPLPHYKHLGAIDLTQARNAKTGQSAYDRWLELMSEPILGGRNLHDALDATINSSAYQRLKENAPPDPIYRDHPAVRMLRSVMDAYRERAWHMMLDEPGFEELRAAINDFDFNRRVAPVAPTRRRESTTLEELLRR